MVKFTSDQGGIDRAVAEVTAKVQAQFNQALRATVREVRDEMSGQPVEVVEPELLSRLSSRIEGVDWDHAVLRSYAEAISEGTLED